MQRRIFVILLLSLAVCACGPLPHSFGPKNTRVDHGANQSPLERNKKIYVAMTGVVPEDMAGTPEALTLQFAKFLAPAATAVYPGERLETRDEALRGAGAKACDYVFLLTVEKWNTALLLRPIRAILDVEVVDAASAETLSRSRLEAVCRVMLVGLEPSPRECIRPQIDDWLNRIFQVGAPANASPYPNVMPPTPAPRP